MQIRCCEGPPADWGPPAARRWARGARGLKTARSQTWPTTEIASRISVTPKAFASRSIRTSMQTTSTRQKLRQPHLQGGSPAQPDLQHLLGRPRPGPGRPAARPEPTASWSSPAPAATPWTTFWPGRARSTPSTSTRSRFRPLELKRAGVLGLDHDSFFELFGQGRTPRARRDVQRRDAQHLSPMPRRYWDRNIHVLPAARAGGNRSTTAAPRGCWPSWC